MVKREEGFTLVELMITVLLFVFVLAAASQVFTGLLTQFKQQSKIAETHIEGIVGLEMMRRDIEHAGYGLPWDMGGAAYAEVVNAASPAVTGLTTQNDESYNDSPANPARAVVSGDSAGQGGSDVLVIKAVNVVSQTNGASSKWTHLFFGNTVTEWDPDTERLQTSDRVIVIQPATRQLVSVLISPGVRRFSSRYDLDGANPDRLIDLAGNPDTGLVPNDDTETRVVYGITSSSGNIPLRMPFNRADYYVRTPGTLPTRCADGTGVLYKAAVTQDTASPPNGGSLNELPLLDCVADLQVIYRWDEDNNPATPDTSTNDISALTAEQIRNQLTEVWVFVLSHEGQRDPNFTFTNWTGSATCATCVRVGTAATVGRDVNLGPGGLNITDFENYRWKVNTLIVRLTNLR